MLSGTLSGNRELKLSEELQQTRLCLVEIEETVSSQNKRSSPFDASELLSVVQKAGVHAASAKELAELIKQVRMATQCLTSTTTSLVAFRVSH